MLKLDNRRYCLLREGPNHGSPTGALAGTSGPLLRPCPERSHDAFECDIASGLLYGMVGGE